MPIPIVVLSVDCVCAAQGKCFVPEFVDVAEKHCIPLTWLLGVTEHDPMTNVKLYHNEYLHRIPAWHELGLHISFDTGVTNTVDRGDLIRIGKDILKAFSIKPTAFRAARGDLEASDLKALEDIGILVDSTAGSHTDRPVTAPPAPYHPSYTHPHQCGAAKLWEFPVANVSGAPGYLDGGFERVKTIIDGTLPDTSILSLALRDCDDDTAILEATVGYLKSLNARFVTMTQLVSEL